MAAVEPPPAPPALPTVPPSRMVLRPVRHASPAREPSEALRVHADLLRRGLERPGGRPARWTAPAFEREVELVRAHLRPIRTVEMLAASYGRESFQSPEGDRPIGAASLLARNAVEVAYAIRRLELDSGQLLPPWPTLLG